MSLFMTKQEREAFLADVHVGVISIAEVGRGPLTVPIWYNYEAGGEIRIMTGRESRKEVAARADRFSLLCADRKPAVQIRQCRGSHRFYRGGGYRARFAPARAPLSRQRRGRPLCRGDAKPAVAYRQRVYPHATRPMANCRLLQGIALIDIARFFDEINRALTPKHTLAKWNRYACSKSLKGHPMQKVVPHLWFYKEAKEAAEFYTSTFPDQN